MALKFNSVESIAIKEGLIGDVYEGTKGEVDDFVINALSNYYPIKIVKRFIFRPLLGRWYPYIDVKSPGYSTQLSLFLGKLNMSFSLEKTCSVCGTELTFKNSIDNYIPLGLCEKCLSKLHYNYWYCLNKVYNEHNSIDHSTQTPKANQICENLLLPSCGFPMVSEKTNQCLKNHGIGLVITDNITLKIIIGTLDTLKYKIIRGGGLIGIILGYSDRIMNIEILGRIFKDFLQFIRSCAKEFNDNTKFSSKNFDFFQETVVKVAVNHDNLSSINESKENTISWWFLINFLRYWILIREVFQTLIKNFNIKIILVSATLPMIFNEKSSFELVKDKEQYFNSLDRINIFIQKRFHFELIDLLDFFIHYLKNHPEEKKNLCVFNTRKSARQFFHALNRKIEDRQSFYLFFLSSDVLIKDRQERIKIIKEYLSERNFKKKLILISTQVIEAGIDLDFNVVFRDFAPLDSLIQVAGRCNRNNSLKKKGEFYIFRLFDIENENYFSDYIYDLTLLEITKKIIFKFNNNSELNSKFLKLSENAWFEMSKEYFQKIQKEKYSTPDYSLRILNEIYKFNFFDISKKFKLIEDFSNFQFYLNINEESNNIWKKFLDLKNERDLTKRYSKYINLKSDLESYILNYNANRTETKNITDFMLKYKLNTSKRNFIYIPRELIELIYDICGLNFERF